MRHLRLILPTERKVEQISEMRKGKLVNTQILALIRYLQTPAGRSVPQLVKEMGISRASVYRYLITIQEMGLPLTSENRGREVFYFFDMNNPLVGKNIFESIPFLKDDFLFDKDEKLLIELLFSNADGTFPALSNRINNLHEKMQTLLSFAGHVSDTERIVQIKTDRRGVSIVHSFIDLPKKKDGDKMDIITKLCEASFSHRKCTVTYRSQADTVKTYDIMPLIVFSFQGGIYTIAETEFHDYWCKLAIERIESLEVKSEHFTRKTTLDIEYTLTDPFGIIQCDQFEIKVRVNSTNARYLMDREWPADRVSFSEPDEKGNVIFTCITSGEFEVLRWLRYLGSGAKLIYPPELVGKLKDSIKELCETYDLI